MNPKLAGTREPSRMRITRGRGNCARCMYPTIPGWGLACAVLLTVAAARALYAQPTNCVAPPSGLVCWWPAEGAATDIVSGQNGTLNGGIRFIPGKRGLAFQLDGTSGYVKVPASSVIDVGRGPGLTMEGWIAPSSVVDQMPVMEWDDPALGLGVHLWISVPPPYGPGSGCLYAALGPGLFLASAAGLIVANAFQHVAATYDVASGVCTLYLNGAIVAQQNFGSFTPDTTYSLYLGTRQIYGAWYWVGVLDELSLYARALSADEVAAIYAAGSAGKCPPPAPVPLGIQMIPGNAVLTWPNPAFTLQSAPAPAGTFTDIAGALSPYTNAATGSQQYFRLRANWPSATGATSKPYGATHGSANKEP